MANKVTKEVNKEAYYDLLQQKLDKHFKSLTITSTIKKKIGIAISKSTGNGFSSGKGKESILRRTRNMLRIGKMAGQVN